VFNKTHDGQQISICVYVDDLLCSCKDQAGLDWLVEQLKVAFKKLTINDGNKFDFVSLEITRCEGEIQIRMAKYIKSLLEEWGGSGTNTSPSDPDLYQRDPVSPPLEDLRKAQFHRRVYRLLYFAKRLGPDILLAVSLLCGQVTAPTLQDWDRLERVYRYLNGQQDRYIRYASGGKISIETFIDASFACYQDSRSRTGCILRLAGLFIGAWTSRQDLNTKSSTESEIVGATDECGWAIWAQNWLKGQGYQPPPPTIYQDNTSVLAILKKGPGAQLRTRHLSIRFHFLGDLLRRGEVNIVYCKTLDMLADGLTKALVGTLFSSMRDRLITVI
jgi:hypothetical protein